MKFNASLAGLLEKEMSNLYWPNNHNCNLNERMYNYLFLSVSIQYATPGVLMSTSQLFHKHQSFYLYQI